MDEAAQVVLLLLAVVLVTGMIFSLPKGLFSPYFLFFSYLTVGIVVRGLFLVDVSAFEDAEFWPFVAPLVQNAFFPAYLELLTSIVVAVLTSRLFARIQNPLEDRVVHFFSFSSDQIHFGATVGVALFSAFTFVAALAASQGGVAEAFLVLQKRSLVFGSEVFFIRILCVICSVAVCLLVYKVSAEQASSRLRKTVILGVVLLNVVLLLLSGGRGEVMKQMLVLLYVRNRGLNKGGIGLPTIALIGVTGSIVVVGGLAMRRSAQFGVDFSEAIGDSFQTAGRSISSAFPITDLYLATRYYADTAGHDYGMQFLLYFVRFIPRSLWEAKPLNLGYQMREFYFGDTLAGVIPTMFGEFYIAWGHFGTIVCGVFLGWMLSFLNRAYGYALRDSKFAIIYMFLTMTLVFDGLRAGLEIAVFMILYILATLGCFKLATRFAILR